MRNPDFCLCENKGADQLCSNCTTDQRLCFRYSDTDNFSSTYSQTFKHLACFSDCTGRFVSDLVGNPEDRFSRVEQDKTGKRPTKEIIQKHIWALLHKLKLPLNLKLPLSSRSLLMKMALIFCCIKQF